MKPGLQFRLNQQLTLTPQLQQAIRLLQLSQLELEAELRQIAEGNPLLEFEEEAASAENDDLGGDEVDIYAAGNDAAAVDHNTDDAPEWPEDAGPVEAPIDFSMGNGSASGNSRGDEDFEPQNAAP